MVTRVKDFKSHICTCAPPSIDISCDNSYCSQAKPSCDEHVHVETCDNSYCSQAKPSCDEHVLVETCDNFITSENDELKKLEKGSTVTCVKLSQINLMTSYQKVDKAKIKKKAHVKCFECSRLRHFSSECPNKKSDQIKPFIR
jgi:hypothetical protein